MESYEQAFFDGFAAKDARLLRASALRALTGSTYDCILHPLGFYLIRLAVRGDTTVRLHYWPAHHREKGTAITPYHDHVWSLCSCIISGTVENVLIDLHADPLGDFELADIRQTGVVDDVIPASSRVRMSIRSTATYRAGDFYDILPRVFHCTNVRPDEAAVTVVLSTVVVQGGPRTLLPIDSAGHMPSRQAVTNSEQVVLEIIHLLSAQSNGTDRHD
jgi:hypothetical protein